MLSVDRYDKSRSFKLDDKSIMFDSERSLFSNGQYYNVKLLVSIWDTNSSNNWHECWITSTGVFPFKPITC